MLRKALLSALFTFCALRSFAAFVPVAVTGYTADVVANGVGNASASITADVDGAGWAFVAQNFQATATSTFPTYYLPNSGLINSANTAGLSFQLAGYSANNCLRLTAQNSSGTLTFPTPTSAGEVYVMGTGGSGACTVDITITFTDASTQVFTGRTEFADWYPATANVTIAGVGRVSTTNNTLEGSTTGGPKFYEAKLVLLPANFSKQIAGITVTKTNSGAVLNIMGVSIGTLCTGTPTAGTAQSSLANVCPGIPFTLTAAGSSSGPGIIYQWQSSPNGTTWTDISGGTTNPYTLAAGQPATTQYRAQVTCVSGTPVTSSIVTVTSTAPSLTTTTPGTRCGTGTVTLSAVPPASTYVKWYSAATGGTLLATGNSFTTPSITTTTTYYASAAPAGALGSGALITANSGSSTGNSVSPYSHYYGGYKTQYIITAAELTSIGLAAGNINSLAFEVTTAGIAYNGFAISMGATANTAMTTSFITAGLTPVYSGASNSTVGINNYVFSTPFNWNGTSNVVVSLCWSNNNGGGTAAEVKYDATPFVAMAYYRADNQAPATICGATTATGILSFRPRMFFNFSGGCEGARTAVAATVTAPPAITVSSPQSPGICTGGTATVNVSSGNTGYTYLWSPSAQTTNSISVTPTATTTYTVTATDNTAGPNAGCVAIGSVVVNVSTPPPVPVVSPSASSICQGSSVTLIATASVLGSATFGTGTSTNATTSYPAPYSNFYGGTKHQMLILASELNAAGLTAGANINSVAFTITLTGSGFAGTLANFQINMGHTTSTVLNSTSFVAAPSVVYGPLAQVIPTTSLPQNVTHTFTAPFTWNGVDNIVIQTSYSTSNGGSAGVQMANSTTPFVSTNWYRVDNGTAAAVLGATTPTSSGSARPNMTITHSKKPGVNWQNLTGLFKDPALTQAVTANDTNTTVYAAPVSNASYTAIANQLGCLSAGASNAATVAVNPTPSTAITPASAGFCPNDSVLLSGPTGANLSYQWNLGGNPITGATNSTLYAKVAGSYTVKVTNTTTGCFATTATPVAVIVNPVPTATITPAGPTTFCNGSSVQLNGNTGAGLTYQWFQGGIAASGQTANSYTVNTAGSFTLRVTNSVGCSAMSAPVTTNVNTTPSTITASGTTTFCVGGSVILKAPANNSYTYVWKKDGVTITGATDSGYTVTGVATSTNTYTVQVTNTATGCTSTTNPGTVVTVGPAPAATVTPSATNQTICQGSTLNLATNPAGGLSYQWYKNNVAIFGANAVTYGITTAGTYTVTVSSGPGCTSLSNPITVGVNPLPPASATALGNTTICQGDSVKLQGSSGPGLTYQWNFNGAPIPSATSIQYTATAAGNYTISVTNTNGCIGVSNAVTVNVNPLPVATITPASATTFCAGINVVLNANNGSGLSYQWLTGTNAITGATTGSYTATTSGNYSVRVTNGTTGCVNFSAPVQVTANPLPVVATTPAGPNAGLCAGSTLTISVPYATGTTYQWSLTGNALSGATSSSYSTSIGGSYTVNAIVTATGCSATSAPVNVTVNPVPTVTTTPTGQQALCETDTLQVAATATGTGISYQWKLGGSNLAGATLPNFGATAAGSLTVEVTNQFGCKATSLPVVITLKPKPQSYLTYQSALVFCQGSAVVLNANNTEPGLTYQWYLNGQPFANTGYFFSAANSGAYTVTTTNSVGCSRLSAPVSVVVNAKPIPVIVESPAYVLKTVANNYATYQWYKNNLAIAGATSATYNVTNNGSYYVRVVDVNGCENSSQQFNINSLAVGSATLGQAIRLYPNPTTGILRIEAPVKVKVTVRDMRGSTVFSLSEATQVDLSALADGLYMIHISDLDGQLLKMERVNKATR